MTKAQVRGRTRGSDRAPIEIDYLGHAGFVVRAAGMRILIDPWFFPAFLDSWFPWPDNRHLLADVWSEPVDFIYVSHIHQDHLDHRTLAGINKNAVVLCPNFRSKSVMRTVRDLGFTQLRALGHGESVGLSPGLTVTMLLDTSHKEDSALLVDTDRFRFLDLNDCHMRLNEMPRNIDLLAAQFSGAMWYPNCYRYPPFQMAAKVRQVRANLIDTLARTCLACDARWYLPSAGPACFLDPDLADYNDPNSTIFHRWDDVREEFSARSPETAVIVAGPGDRILGWPNEVRLAERKPPASAESLNGYRERRRNEWDIHLESAAGVTTESLNAYFASLQRKNRQLLDGSSMRLRLVSEEQAWDVRLGPYPELEVVPIAGDHPPEYTFEVPGWVIRMIIDHDTTWEDALLSMRIRLSRQPDIFDMKLFGLLRYGHQPVQTQQMVLDSQTPEELIQQKDWCFQRFCPHAGEDLSHAKIEGEVIECPRHHWKWNLRTGECIDGGTLNLNVRVGAAT